MNLFVLEGPIDAIFVKTILCWHFGRTFNKQNIRNVIVDDFNKRIPRKRGVNILKEYLTTNYYYFYIKETLYGLIIYGDNGRKTIIELVLPTLVFDIIQNTPEPNELRLFTILDEDGRQLNSTIDEIFSKLDNQLARKGWNDKYNIGLIQMDKTIKVTAIRDTRYSIVIKVFQIPSSLEIQLVHRGVQKLRISRKQKQKLLKIDPHEALRQIADLVGINRDKLIEKSVLDQWFIGEEWYKNLLNEISTFCKLKLIRKI